MSLCVRRLNLCQGRCQVLGVTYWFRHRPPFNDGVPLLVVLSAVTVWVPLSCYYVIVCSVGALFDNNKVIKVYIHTNTFEFVFPIAEM